MRRGTHHGNKVLLYGLIDTAPARGNARRSNKSRHTFNGPTEITSRKNTKVLECLGVPSALVGSFASEVVDSLQVPLDLGWIGVIDYCGTILPKPPCILA